MRFGRELGQILKILLIIYDVSTDLGMIRPTIIEGGDEYRQKQSSNPVNNGSYGIDLGRHSTNNICD